MYRAYVWVISRCLISNEDVPLCVRDHAWRYSTETRKLNTAAQAVVHHGRSASGVDEFGVGLLLKSGAIPSILGTYGRKAEAIDVDG